jgi:hemolysin activation/secretion protein
MLFRNAMFLGMITLLLFGCASPTATEAPAAETVAPAETIETETKEATVETEEPMQTEEPAQVEGEQASAGVVFTIVPEETEARFKINEVLLGEDFTVIGG